MPQPELGGLVLSGGGAVRMGGADKSSLEVEGRTLLEISLDALVDIDDVVVVGPEVPTERPVTFRHEDPPAGGPAAAVIAGLSGFARPPLRVVVLAVDMPRVTPATIRRLTAQEYAEGAVLVDEAGRVQYLCAVYDCARLRAAGAGDVHGMPMRELVKGMELMHVPAIGDEAHDIDTWDEVRLLREQWSNDSP